MRMPKLRNNVKWMQARARMSPSEQYVASLMQPSFSFEASNMCHSVTRQELEEHMDAHYPNFTQEQRAYYLETALSHPITGVFFRLTAISTVVVGLATASPTRVSSTRRGLFLAEHVVDLVHCERFGDMLLDIHAELYEHFRKTASHLIIHWNMLRASRVTMRRCKLDVFGGRMLEMGRGRMLEMGRGRALEWE